MERLVSMYLDYAEEQAERKIPMSMQDWSARLDGFLEFNGRELLIGPGKISAEQAKLHAETEFENRTSCLKAISIGSLRKTKSDKSFRPQVNLIWRPTQ